VGAPDAGPAVVGIATGISQSCALLSTGGVKCWGGNTNGQLGDGTTTPHLVPADVIALGGPVTQISLSTSDAHACALMASGGVKCWGDNTTGQLGDGTFTQRLAPVDVLSLGGVATQVSAGLGFSCAVLQAGGIKCWGDNSSAQLGNGGGGSSATPVDVASLGGTAIQVAAGDSYACAILLGGAVRCWGANGGGQLGDGTNTPRPVPTDVATLGGTATHISATFDSHTCAVLSTGDIRCWGNGTSGQLGNGGVVSSSSPVTVSALGGVATMVRVSVDNTCALLADGSARCWGRNSVGQNGDGTTTQHTTPVAVVSLGGVAIDLTAGNATACALLSSGTARCWGANGAGALGDGTTTNQPLPVTVLGLP
jgi:alpha-tubulin suppressor-like RCC1 family protein